MKTTQRKATIACRTINGMSRTQLKSPLAFKLYMMKKALMNAVDFQAEEEEKLAESLGVKISETGQFLFPDQETQVKFMKAHNEMLDAEAEIPAEPINVSVKDIPEISIAEIEALDGFINFE